MVSPTLPSMGTREFEAFIVSAMTEDGWKRVPVEGLQLTYCFAMIAEYIAWLRDQRGK